MVFLKEWQTQMVETFWQGEEQKEEKNLLFLTNAKVLKYNHILNTYFHTNFKEHFHNAL